MKSSGNFDFSDWNLRLHSSILDVKIYFVSCDERWTTKVAILESNRNSSTLVNRNEVKSCCEQIRSCEKKKKKKEVFSGNIKRNLKMLFWGKTFAIVLEKLSRDFLNWFLQCYEHKKSWKLMAFDSFGFIFTSHFWIVVESSFHEWNHKW